MVRTTILIQNVLTSLSLANTNGVRNINEKINRVIIVELNCSHVVRKDEHMNLRNGFLICSLKIHRCVRYLLKVKRAQDPLIP